MNRKTWFMMFFSFTGSTFSFEPLGLAKGSGCALTVVPRGHTGPLPWVPRDAIKIRMTPDKNSDQVLLFPDLSCQGTPGVSSSAR